MEYDCENKSNATKTRSNGPLVNIYISDRMIILHKQKFWISLTLCYISPTEISQTNHKTKYTFLENKAYIQLVITKNK